MGRLAEAGRAYRSAVAQGGVLKRGCTCSAGVRVVVGVVAVVASLGGVREGRRVALRYTRA